MKHTFVLYNFMDKKAVKAVAVELGFIEEDAEYISNQHPLWIPSLLGQARGVGKKRLRAILAGLAGCEEPTLPYRR